MRERAIALHGQGRAAEAQTLYDQIIRARPDDFQALLMGGVLAAQRQQLERAARLFRRAIRADASSPQAHNNLGIILGDLKELERAVASFDRAIALEPLYADAYSNRGVALGRLKRLAQALSSCNRAIELQPQSASAHCNQAGVLRLMGQPQQALVSYQRALALAPAYATALVNCAKVLGDLGRPEEALAHSARAIELQPAHVEAHALHGAVLCTLNRPAEALCYCDRALSLMPEFAAAHNQRGLALDDLGQHASAIASFDAAIALDRADPAAYYNRARAHEHLQQFDEALADYERAIALNPEEAEAYFGMALCLLRQGEFARGWPLYEWRRRRKPPNAGRIVTTSEELWSGLQALKGRSLHIHWEQGYGDTLQFCRYATLAARQGARVLLDVQPALRSLLRSLDSRIEILADSAPRDADLQIPMMSLPAAFAASGTAIPAETPYLSADPERVLHWRYHLGVAGFRIGICWQGSEGRVDIGRSFPASLFSNLGTLPGVRLISLQKGRGAEQLARLPEGMVVETLGNDFDAGADAFLDSAAVMHNLDLIVTSDTAIAHLAGALARPTWVLLPYVPDWRWMLDRDDSPWYPTLRLFRQPCAGDWQQVFVRVRQALSAQLGMHRR